MTALTGFQYSAVEKSLTFAPGKATHFWSNGCAWGTCSLGGPGSSATVEVAVLHGSLDLARFDLAHCGSHAFKVPLRLQAGQQAAFKVPRSRP